MWFLAILADTQVILKQFLTIFMIHSDSQVILGNSQAMLADSHDSCWFSSDSQWFLQFSSDSQANLSDSHWFLVIIIILTDSQIVMIVKQFLDNSLGFLSNSQLFLWFTSNYQWFSLIHMILKCILCDSSLIPVILEQFSVILKWF